MKMITFRDVSKIYHIGGEEVRALDHASMQIEQGEFVGIIGPSGNGVSGKHWSVWRWENAEATGRRNCPEGSSREWRSQGQS